MSQKSEKAVIHEIGPRMCNLKERERESDVVRVKAAMDSLPVQKRIFVVGVVTVWLPSYSAVSEAII